jgi:hypothetical protein
MGWEVDEIEGTVREVRARGVVFEAYDFPGLKTVDGIAEIDGNYPSKGTDERGAWFRDSEGNVADPLVHFELRPKEAERSPATEPITPCSRRRRRTPT